MSEEKDPLASMLIAKEEHSDDNSSQFYYRYRDNFDRNSGSPKTCFFDTLAEAYEHLLEDGDGACLFHCDGIEMAQPYFPPPMEYLEKVIQEINYVEIEIGYPDHHPKDIWILRKKGKKEDDPRYAASIKQN